MADIVSTLFGINTPVQDQVQTYRDTQAGNIGSMWGLATLNPYDQNINADAHIKSQAAQAQLGNRLGSAIGGMFGIKDPMLEKATTIEGILQQTQQELGEDANDPAKLYPAIYQKFIDNNLTQEAMQVQQVAQKAIQEQGLNQAKIANENAQSDKWRAEVININKGTPLEITRLQDAYDDAVSKGQVQRAKQLKAKIEGIEKETSPQNRAEEVLLNTFIRDLGDEKGSMKFIEWKSSDKNNKEKLIATDKPIYNPETAKWIIPPAQPDAPPTNLQKGERWNASKGVVESIPGSELYIKQSDKFTKDYSATKTAITQADEGIKRVTALLSDKKGLEANFGGYNALISGNTPFWGTDYKVKLEGFKSTLRQVGLDLLREKGSIGQITEREWPMIEKVLASIDPRMSEDEAKAAFNELKIRFENIKKEALDTYSTEWGKSQFYKDIGETRNTQQIVSNGTTYNRPTGMTDAQWQEYQNYVKGNK